jgi:hypothetical protein
VRIHFHISRTTARADVMLEFTDKTFSSKYTGAASAGIIRGAYHFAHPNKGSGAAQAQFFLANGGGWSNDGMTLPGAIDLESACLPSLPPLSSTLADGAGHRRGELPGVLRPESIGDGVVDQGLQQHVPGEHRPGPGHLHEHELVEVVHGQLGRVWQQPAVARALLVERRRAACGMGTVRTCRCCCCEGADVVCVQRDHLAVRQVGEQPGRSGQVPRLHGRAEDVGRVRITWNSY